MFNDKFSVKYDKSATIGVLCQYLYSARMWQLGTITYEK